MCGFFWHLPPSPPAYFFDQPTSTVKSVPLDCNREGLSDVQPNHSSDLRFASVFLRDVTKRIFRLAGPIQCV